MCIKDTYPFLVMYRRTSQVKHKPKVVEDYNQHMLGVDKLDQLATYLLQLPAQKCEVVAKTVSFWCLEVAVINSFIISQIEKQWITLRKCPSK